MNTPAAQAPHRRSFFSYLLRSHIAIASIGAAALLITLLTGTLLTRNLQQLSTTTIPIFQASAAVLRGIQHSLANMRGWVSLNDQAFYEDWLHIWNRDIDPAALELRHLGYAMHIPGFEKRFQELILLLAELKESQWWVFEIAQTPGNQQAITIHRFEIKPILHTLDAIFSSFLNGNNGQLAIALSKEQHQSIHKIILYYSRVKEILLEIIFQGKINQEERYNAAFALLKSAAAELNVITTGKGENSKELQHTLQRELTALERVAAKSIRARKSPNWNISRHLMETETVPLTKRITQVMNSLTTDFNSLRDRQLALAKSRGRYSALAMFLLLTAMFAAAIFISRRSAEKLARPVLLLADAARQMADGTLQSDVPATSDDELGDLTHSFNNMRRELQNSEQQLLRQQKLATIGQLSGSVAHDIRNPLGAISNSIYFLKLISDASTDERIRDHLNIMASEITRATTIINDLLDFSRENIPNISMEDLNALLQQLLSAPTLLENITHEIELDETLPLIPCDLSHMERIFNNLIQNGQQAMPNGGTLSITTSHDADSIQITVTDTGHGMDGEQMEQIFEPLFTTRASGVGLGLSIVKDLVEKHHGKIEVESVSNAGSTFRVFLPLKQKK